MEETKKYYYETGELKKEIVYENGGVILYTTFHKNGQLECRMNLSDGKKNGNVMVFHENGQLESDIDYQNDVPVDGPYTIFLQDGTIWEKGTFKNNGQEIDLIIRGGKPTSELYEIKENINQISDSDKIQDYYDDKK